MIENMSLKNKIIVGFIIIILLVLLIPIPIHLKDGGSVEYKALTYKVSKIHRINSEGFDEGIIIKILGIKVYDNVKFKVNDTSSNKIDDNSNNEEDNVEKLPQAYVNNDGSIIFPDKNFEEAIKKYLNIQDKITLEKAKKVTKIVAENSNITNIAGIEYFSNIEFLNLMDNKISDVSNIKNLKKIKNLYLANNFIKDISVLSNLENLNVLNIEENEISDISSLKMLKYIDYPSIKGNPIINFDILLNKVDVLHANYLKILDLSSKDSYAIEERKSKINEYNNNQLAVDKMKSWVEENITEDMSDLEKEYEIINHIIDILDYSYDERPYDGNIYDMYINGNSVCYGYALIFQYLANFANLENYRVETRFSSEEIASGLQNHVWNIVKIDDLYYQLDLTWADTDVTDYKYINVSNEKMNELHNYDYLIYKLEYYPSTNVDMKKDIQIRYQKNDSIND